MLPSTIATFVERTQYICLIIAISKFEYKQVHTDTMRVLYSTLSNTKR